MSEGILILKEGRETNTSGLKTMAFWNSYEAHEFIDS
jgi:hypothetical protein